MLQVKQGQLQAKHKHSINDIRGSYNPRIAVQDRAFSYPLATCFKKRILLGMNAQARRETNTSVISSVASST